MTFFAINTKITVNIAKIDGVYIILTLAKVSYKKLISYPKNCIFGRFSKKKWFSCQRCKIQQKIAFGRILQENGSRYGFLLL